MKAAIINILYQQCTKDYLYVRGGCHDEGLMVQIVSHSSTKRHNVYQIVV